MRNVSPLTPRACVEHVSRFARHGAALPRQGRPGVGVSGRRLDRLRRTIAQGALPFRILRGERQSRPLEPRRDGGAGANGSARAVSSPEPNPLEDATWVHRRVEAPRRGELEVENRREREQSERKGSDTQGAQSLAGEEDVDGEARAFVAAKHERADERRNQEIDEPIPRSSAAEVEPLPIEPEGHEMDDRTDQQGDREEPEAGGSRDRHAVGSCRGGSGVGIDRCHVRSLLRTRRVMGEKRGRGALDPRPRSWDKRCAKMCRHSSIADSLTGQLASSTPEP